MILLEVKKSYMNDFYDWNKTLSFDAEVNIVISNRGKGKTYGLRKQFISDFIKHGWCFGHITRTKEELKAVMKGYFLKLEIQDDFPKDYVTKSEGQIIYISKNTKKKDWKPFGYFAALSQEQLNKQLTFVNIKRIVFDEAVLNYTDRYHQYLFDEYDKLINLISSMTRERRDSEIKPRIYLLGNACDLFNPYFIAYGIKKIPDYGYRWYKSKTCLLHYVEPGEYANELIDDTVAGHMAKGTNSEAIFARNEFMNANDSFIKKKPKNARFSFGLKYMGQRFGVWVDLDNGYYYVNDKIPNNETTVFTLTNSDDEPNYIIAARSNKILKNFRSYYYMGILLFDNPQLKNDFMGCLDYIGSR